MRHYPRSRDHATPPQHSFGRIPRRVRPFFGSESRAAKAGKEHNTGDAMQVFCVAPLPPVATPHSSAALKLFTEPGPAAQDEAEALLAACAPIPLPTTFSQPPPPPAGSTCATDAPPMSHKHARHATSSGPCTTPSTQLSHARTMHAPHACIPIVRLLAFVHAERQPRPSVEVLSPSNAAEYCDTCAAHNTARSGDQERDHAASHGQHALLEAGGAPQLVPTGLLLEHFDMSLLQLLRLHARCAADGTPSHSRSASTSEPPATPGASSSGALAASLSDLYSPELAMQRAATRLPTLDMLRVLCAVCCGVEALHRRGMLHMDIKAANVLTMVRLRVRSSAGCSVLPAARGAASSAGRRHGASVAVAPMKFDVRCLMSAPAGRPRTVHVLDASSFVAMRICSDAPGAGAFALLHSSTTALGGSSQPAKPIQPTCSAMQPMDTPFHRNAMQLPRSATRCTRCARHAIAAVPEHPTGPP